VNSKDKIKNFKDLKIWQKGIELVLRVILSPSHIVILNVVKNLLVKLRVNSAKNLRVKFKVNSTRNLCEALLRVHND
jgi:hypothetical protein